MFRRRYGTRLRGTSPITRPAIEMRPSEGSISFISRRMQVDLPQPVGPTRNTKSPRPIRIDTRSSPTDPPSYTFVTSSNSTTGTLRPCGGRGRSTSRAGAGISVLGTEAIRPYLIPVRAAGWVECSASCKLSAPEPVAQIQLAAVLHRPDELQLHQLGERRAGHDRESVLAARERRGDGEE